MATGSRRVRKQIAPYGRSQTTWAYPPSIRSISASCPWLPVENGGQTVEYFGGDRKSAHRNAIPAAGCAQPQRRRLRGGIARRNAGFAQYCRATQTDQRRSLLVGRPAPTGRPLQQTHLKAC